VVVINQVQRRLDDLGGAGGVVGGVGCAENRVEAGANAAARDDGGDHFLRVAEEALLGTRARERRGLCRWRGQGIEEHRLEDRLVWTDYFHSEWRVGCVAEGIVAAIVELGFVVARGS
jgi:hypothetical protein